MKKEKALNRPSINKELFNIRNKKKLSLKEAAKGLGINRLHLKLIERGYLNVSKKLEPKFISYYKLNKSFFKVNSNYITPIDIKYDDDVDIEKKIRARARSKRTKIISGIVSALLLGAIVTGVYFFNRDTIYPRANWTDEFTTFRDEYISFCKNSEDEYHAGVRKCLEYPDDDEYYFKTDDFDMGMPGQAVNASGTYIDFSIDLLKVKIFSYNQRKSGTITGTYEECTIRAIFTYKKLGEYSLPKIVLVDRDLHDNTYYPKSEEYKKFYNYLFNEENGEFNQSINEFNNSLKEISSSYTFEQLFNDTQKASAYQIFGFRLGFRLILFPSILLVLSLAIFTYAMFKGRKIKPKKEKKKPYVVHKFQYNTDVALTYRGFTEDIKFPLIIPEFVLRIIAIAILLLSSIGVAWLTNEILSLQESSKAMDFNSYVSNFLVAGITLAFFIKLDVYHKKTNRQLLENILIFFVFGLIFYIAECITYGCLATQRTIYSEIIKLLSNLIPGNILWNLMLYSIIFLFLFTLPKSIEDQPHKVLMWRLGSAIPTLLLIAAFIYKGTLRGAMSPYVSFLFHTNGLLSTAFAIFYLYALFFFQQYVNLKYGKEFMNTFLNSRRYALEKNIIACVILLVLSAIDLVFYFKLPVNDLNLGNNWIITILIPLILFYRPHIGKRLKKWDISYVLMYGISLTGGYIASFMMLASALDLSQFSQILN